MPHLNKLHWELTQEPAGEYLIYADLTNELKLMEDELLQELAKDKVDRKKLKERNKLNKLLAKIPPFHIKEYDLIARFIETQGGLN